MQICETYVGKINFSVPFSNRVTNQIEAIYGKILMLQKIYFLLRY